jgi:hypothetical protein
MRTRRENATPAGAAGTDRIAAAEPGTLEHLKAAATQARRTGRSAPLRAAWQDRVRWRLREGITSPEQAAADLAGPYALSGRTRLAVGRTRRR